jgi:hypothetical protein
VEIAGQPMRVKVAHMRLCASRAVYVRAYPRETQEMVCQPASKFDPRSAFNIDPSDAGVCSRPAA